MSTGAQLKSKALYYAFGRNDAVGGVPYVDAGVFSSAFLKHFEDTGHIVNVKTAFDRFRDGKSLVDV